MPTAGSAGSRFLAGTAAGLACSTAARQDLPCGRERRARRRASPPCHCGYQRKRPSATAPSCAGRSRHNLSAARSMFSAATCSNATNCGRTTCSGRANFPAADNARNCSDCPASRAHPARGRRCNGSSSEQRPDGNGRQRRGAAITNPSPTPCVCCRSGPRRRMPRGLFRSSRRYCPYRQQPRSRSQESE